MDLNEFLQHYEKVPVQHYPHRVPEKPLVTVCVQTYQQAQYIEKCLDGILMQKVSFDYEVLLGEDASDDGTRETCIAYAQQHPEKIKLILHRRENNIKIRNSPSGRFNFIYNILSAKGKYIALCEGDDYWIDPLKLQKQVTFMEANLDFVMCYSAAQIQDHKGNIIDDPIVHPHSEVTTLTDLAQIGNFIHTPSVLFRAAGLSLPRFLIDSPLGDYPLYVLLAQTGLLMRLPDVTTVYRHGTGNWSRQSSADRHMKTAIVNRLLYTYFKNIGEAHRVDAFLQRVLGFVSKWCEHLKQSQLEEIAGPDHDLLAKLIDQRARSLRNHRNRNARSMKFYNFMVSIFKGSKQ